MRQFMFCVFAIMMLTSAQAGDEERAEHLLEQAAHEEEQELLECFRCDLGFWDACYTTVTSCSPGERCYTGRGKAGDVLDVKTLGCAQAEECDTVASVELHSNATIYVMTKYCCDTPFCNAAHKLPTDRLLSLTVVVHGTLMCLTALVGS